MLTSFLGTRIQNTVALELKIVIHILVIISIWNGLLIMQNKEFPWLILKMSKYSKQHLPLLANNGQHASFITGFWDTANSPSGVNSHLFTWSLHCNDSSPQTRRWKAWPHNGNHSSGHTVFLVWEMQTFASLNACTVTDTCQMCQTQGTTCPIHPSHQMGHTKSLVIRTVHRQHQVVWLLLQSVFK